MRKLITAILIGITFGTFRCKPLNASDDSLLVTSLRFSPSAFDSFKRNTELRYILTAAVTVSAYIVVRDSVQNESLVKTLVEGLGETKGSHSITWIGDTDQGLFAHAGVYFGVIRVRNQQFETIIQVFHF